MPAPKLTRAERKAKRAEIAASQREATKTALHEAEREANRKNFRKNLIIFGTLCVTMPLLAYGIIGIGNSVADHKERIITLITTNYNVQDAQNIRTRSFTGDDVVISTNNKIHTCRGLAKDDLIAKKPIKCDGGTVIQPKL